MYLCIPGSTHTPSWHRARHSYLRLFPPFQQIREVSKVLAARVAEHMVSAGLSDVQLPAGASWESYVGDHMWEPTRIPYPLLRPFGKL